MNLLVSKIESSANSLQHWSNDSVASDNWDTPSTGSHESKSIRSDYFDARGTIERTPLPSGINGVYPISISKAVQDSLIRYDSESDESALPIDQPEGQLNEDPVMRAQVSVEEIPKSRAELIDVRRQVSPFMDLLHDCGFRNALDDVISCREINEWQTTQLRIERRLIDDDHDANEYIIQVR
ncbi:hypothetical protein QAD02_008165 [Eretmocerus hayati]|uniref:Uncharacterized protein n=1 Tax=Eretmocerus hayati TaxID=131215 RepID=A0ACC2N5R6_9HYME|nr:hypothetical protein QAD02_008165 [Eretmocerus hayati]